MFRIIALKAITRTSDTDKGSNTDRNIFLFISLFPDIAKLRNYSIEQNYE